MTQRRTTRETRAAYRALKPRAARRAKSTTAAVASAFPEQGKWTYDDWARLPDARKAIIGKEYIEGVPDLVVEILSPSNWMYDRQEKFRLYQTSGVPEYWIVDYRAKAVEAFVLENGEFALIGKWGVGETASSRGLSGFQIAVADIFRDI